MQIIITRLFNTGIRFASLGLKLILTLYMGKYLGLTELGTYGLVAAYVAIAITIIGFRTDYVVQREIVGVSEFEVARKMRDQIAFCGTNYLVMFAGVAAVLILPFTDTDMHIILYTAGLTLLESIGTIMSNNLISLKRPILANVFFFVRSALWAVPVIVFGYIQPEYRTADFVFAFWMSGISLSILINLFYWRNMPWLDVFKTPVDWPWIWRSLKVSLSIWISTISAALAGNIDRFVVDYNLNRDFVGIASFYGSFVVAISSLLNSGIFAFGYPHLISLHKEGKLEEFFHVAKKMIIQAGISAGIMCLGIGVIIPLLGERFGRPEFSEYAPVLWLLLFGAWIRGCTEGFFFIMYARHQDREIWLGNFVLLVPAVGFNFILVPLFGFIGVGYSAILAAVAQGLWRIYVTRTYKEKKPTEAWVNE